MNIVLPKLFGWQADVVSKLTEDSWYRSARQYTVLSPRQRGKSFLICSLVLWCGFSHTGTIMVLEPTNAQANRMLRMLKAAIQDTKLCKSINESRGYIQLANGTIVYFKSAEQKEGLRGFTTTLALFIDEAAYIPDTVMQDVIQTTNVNRAITMMFSTPAFASGMFYDSYNRGKNNEDKFTTFDWSYDSGYDFSPVISDDQIEMYRTTYSEQKFKSEVLGQFITDKSFVFGDFSSCIGKTPDNTPVVCGIDWGTGQGSDSTVLTFINRSGHVCRIWATNNMEPVKQVERIAQILNGYTSLVAVLVETNSIGEVYKSTLKAKLNNKKILKEFETNNQSKRDIVEDVIKAFGEHTLMIPDDPDLKRQLSFYTIQPLSNGRYTYNNANDSVHDDYVISLCLAWRAYSKIFNSLQCTRVSWA